MSLIFSWQHLMRTLARAGGEVDGAIILGSDIAPAMARQCALHLELDSGAPRAQQASSSFGVLWRIETRAGTRAGAPNCRRQRLLPCKQGDFHENAGTKEPLALIV
jgi:hypothetical protein